ncbi:MAG: hypothetical protein MJZ38_05625 [archaeon]|nr:hypothetical protein [archaeon]
MTSVETECPSCGGAVSIGELRDQIFCRNCGTRLALTWTVQCTTADGAVSGISGGTASTTGTSANTVPTPEPCKGLRARVNIVLPTNPVKAKGTFSYFGIKIDGRDLSVGKQGMTLPFDTDVGRHELEIRQVNDTLLGTDVRRFGFTIDVSSNCFICLESDGESLRIH